MPTTTKKATKKRKRARTARVSARIGEIEAEVTAKKTTKAKAGRKQLGDALRELPGRYVDETSKFIRGASLAYLENLRLMANISSSFAEEVYGRDRTEHTSLADLAVDFPKNVSTGLANALDESLDIPGKVVHKFCETYEEKG